MCGIAGNNLLDASWTLTEAGREKLEVGELVVDSLGELDAALVAQTECLLEFQHRRGPEKRV
jgi:hypothetical protein